MVEIVHWNPVRRRRRGLAGLLTRPRPVDNFGDLLGPLVVREIVRRGGGDPEARRDGRLLTVGSILSMARAGDVVWGTGANGKLLHEDYDLSRVDVRAVRGPLTRAFAQSKGASVPEVYGDPGLLVGHLWTRAELAGDRPETSRLVVPNFHDLASVRGRHPTLSPLSPLGDCLGAIAASELVVGSSLHGVVIADALGVPARFVRSATEPEFKYRDYLSGTGRSGTAIADSVDEALAMGPHPAPCWDRDALLRAFPAGLWGIEDPSRTSESRRSVTTTGESGLERGPWAVQRTHETSGAEQGAGSDGSS
ncbi:polysaccharide pyruvyl transferase family protein [Cellulosimicrobium sp. Marseille-Q4280]|uniref:polysaccharide pyruvyl transferase family protein n=1 Tax=Cellulosimicrobium sp. Marseille-Q4280 TaxID=2937992 RepID=UPI00203BFDB4|nr:polysaccharide pyruvyl transferase family protein [Cellulosimicrobium sp. Marseille-Q4280]